MPYRNNSRRPPSTNHPGHPLTDEVLEHPEERGDRDECDALGSPALGDEAIKHLEEWLPQHAGDALGSLALGDEVLEHFEEWLRRAEGGASGELTLGDEALEHFEEWLRRAEGEALADPTSPGPHDQPPGMPMPMPFDRAHPLWDRELDG